MFVNNRGVQMPAPSAADGFWAFWLALLVALVAVVMLHRWARRDGMPGRMFPVFWTSLGLFIAIPWLVTLLPGHRSAGRCRSCNASTSAAAGW